MPSPFLRLGASVVMAACLLGGCGHTATERVQSYFGLRDVSSVEAIRAGLLEKVPRGTSEAGIVALLNSGQIGKDGLSDVLPFDESIRTWLGHDGILCRVDLDPATMGFVKEEYSVLFVLDDERKLVDVRVQTSLTGL